MHHAGPQVSGKERQVAWFLCCPTLGRREGGSSVNTRPPGSLVSTCSQISAAGPGHPVSFPALHIYFYLFGLVLVAASCNCSMQKLLVMVMWGLAPQLGVKLWPLHWEQSLTTRPPGKSLLLFNASHFCSFISFQNGHALIHNLPTCCLLTYRAAHSVPGPPLNPGAQAI